LKTGFVIFAHGSSVESANDQVRAVAQALAARGGYDLVETAFLEPVKPGVSDAVEVLAARGAGRVVVIPYFLTLGIHLKRDLPRIVAAAAERHPGLLIEVADCMDGHPALVDILLDRTRNHQPDSGV
jgi:sirohydrochlorin ferrochelatase